MFSCLCQVPVCGAWLPYPAAQSCSSPPCPEEYAKPWAPRACLWEQPQSGTDIPVPLGGWNQAHSCAGIRTGGLRPRVEPSHGRTLQEQDRERQPGEVQAGSICPDILCHFPATAATSVPHSVMKEATCPGPRNGNASSYLDFFFFFSSQVS